MSVVAFSDGLARVYATQLLFHYWPHLQPSFQIEHAVKKNCCELLFEFKFMISVPFKVCNCAAPLNNLRSAISFSRICNIVNLIYGIYMYIPFLVLGTLHSFCIWMVVQLHALHAQQNKHLLSVEFS